MSKNKFIIDVADLLVSPTGTRKQLEFKIDNKSLNEKRIKLGLPITGKIELIRTTDGILVNSEIKSQLILCCQRCLEIFKQNLLFDFQQEFKILNKGVKKDYIILPDRTIDILEPIIQEILLKLPYQVVCRFNCRGLCSKCGKNLNKEKCLHKKQ